MKSSNSLYVMMFFFGVFVSSRIQKEQINLIIFRSEDYRKQEQITSDNVRIYLLC
jgi:hypothetical protein